MGLGGMTCSELVTKNKKQKKNQNRTWTSNDTEHKSNIRKGQSLK
jgi:hypothetical protein